MSLIRALLVIFSLFLTVYSSGPTDKLTPGFRPPAVPLIVHDPYTSYWSVNDHLYDDPPQHWSGAEMGMVGMIRIDSNMYRYMGGLDMGVVNATMKQMNVSVYPTQTVYVFEQDGVQLTLTFSTPAAIMDNTAEFVGMPVTFISFSVVSIDGMDHSVQIYYDNTAEGTVADTIEEVTCARDQLVEGFMDIYCGNVNQTSFGKSFSDRIDWGYWYVSVINDSTLSTSIGMSTDLRKTFAAANGGGPLPADNIPSSVPCLDNNGNKPIIAVSWSLTSSSKFASFKYLRVFYDSQDSISYFGTTLKPLWYQKYGSLKNVLSQLNYEDVISDCGSVDERVINSLYEAGGQNYTTIGALAWRQAVGSTSPVWNNVTNTSWIFVKEISSDGDVSTVDVLFPASPLYLWANPEAMKKMLIPILDYANNQSLKYGLNIPYNLSWAPHHLGKWPVCNLTPNNQEQMPVEESGNMLMMIAGVVKQQNNQTIFLKPYWDLLNTWALYISDSLPDPGNQLCTDDFEGPSPHNTNLAVKGIVGLSAYVYLLETLENPSSSVTDNIKFFKYLIEDYKTYFLSKGLASTSDHYSRQFDKPDSWSLKYNLLYQKILNTSDFSDSVITTEMKYYETKMDTYGIPLDDRHPYTKTDWLMWIAALADNDLFHVLTDRVYKFAHETPERVPFTDWYNVQTGDKKGNFRARPVIGGLYARLLTHPVDN